MVAPLSQTIYNVQAVFSLYFAYFASDGISKHSRDGSVMDSYAWSMTEMAQ